MDQVLYYQVFTGVKKAVKKFERSCLGMQVSILSSDQGEVRIAAARYEIIEIQDTSFQLDLKQNNYGKGNFLLSYVRLQIIFTAIWSDMDFGQFPHFSYCFSFICMAKNSFLSMFQLFPSAIFLNWLICMFF